MEKILLFDNYDSFTYNLVHLVEKITHGKVDVFSNDQLTLDDIRPYDRIILSPGPGLPQNAGLLLPLIKEFAATKSILGVCLGHQAIAMAFGATLENLSTVYHGVAMPIIITRPAATLFRGVAPGALVGRYHSWTVNTVSLPAELEVTAVDEHQHIMALRHKTFDLQSVQFHPESILTTCGEAIMRNWLNIH